MTEDIGPCKESEGNNDRFSKLRSFLKQDLYKSSLPQYAAFLKTAIQFTIGFLLICVLVFKGVVEVLQTFDVVQEERKASVGLSPLITHIVSIHTFGYIAAALAISAGIDLGYMLFTDGPDEALTPLLLCISSAAVYTMSNKPEHNWVVGIYVLSILVLICCMHLYKRWNLHKSD
ncbi:hypothetical protein [Paraburkholderia sediminicola]|uniref:hypothetical protein n=1 Tax=Paraburkholderia sediminicola TaxID=458836 RepID=UPI0038B6F254